MVGRPKPGRSPRRVRSSQLSHKSIIPRQRETASMTKPLNIGMIGYGFMGRAHSNAYRQVNQFFDSPFRPVLKTVCGRDAAKVKAFANQWGYDSVETDWRTLVGRKDIDAIDICTPNNVHCEIALAAAA